MSASRGLTFSKTNYLQPAFHDSNDIKFVYVFKTKFLKSEFRKTIKFTLKIKLNSKNFIIYRLQSELMTFSVVTQTQTKISKSRIVMEQLLPHCNRLRIGSKRHVYCARVPIKGRLFLCKYIYQP